MATLLAFGKDIVGYEHEGDLTDNYDMVLTLPATNAYTFADYLPQIKAAFDALSDDKKLGAIITYNSFIFRCVVIEGRFSCTVFSGGLDTETDYGFVFDGNNIGYIVRTISSNGTITFVNKTTDVVSKSLTLYTLR